MSPVNKAEEAMLLPGAVVGSGRNSATNSQLAAALGHHVAAKLLAVATPDRAEGATLVELEQVDDVDELCKDDILVARCRGLAPPPLSPGGS